jgi:hypothetical protein
MGRPTPAGAGRSQCRFDLLFKAAATACLMAPFLSGQKCNGQLVTFWQLSVHVQSAGGSTRELALWGSFDKEIWCCRTGLNCLPLSTSPLPWKGQVEYGKPRIPHVNPPTSGASWQSPTDVPNRNKVPHRASPDLSARRMLFYRRIIGTEIGIFLVRLSPKQGWIRAPWSTSGCCHILPRAIIGPAALRAARAPRQVVACSRPAARASGMPAPAAAAKGRAS